MKTFRFIPTFAAIAALGLSSGCVSSHISSSKQIAPAISENVPANTLRAPVSVRVTFANAKDEDLRGDIEEALSKSLRSANVATSEGGSVIEVRVENFRRLSSMKKFLLREFSGTSHFDLTITFPTGETIQQHGTAGANAVTFWGQNTGTSIKLIGETVATEVGKRLSQTSFAAR